MSNGLICRNTDQFFPLDSRDQLSVAAIQKLLREASENSRHLCCGCRIEEGYFPRLRVRRLHKSPGYTLVRDDVTEHSPACFLHQTYDDSHRRICYRSEMFLTPPNTRDTTAAAPAAVGAAAYSLSTTYLSFRDYARRVFSEGLCAAYADLNSGSAPFKNPSPEATLSAIRSTIHNLSFDDACDGFAAAKQFGMRLEIGLIYEQLDVDESKLDGLIAWLWSADHIWEVVGLGAAPGVIGHAAISISILGNICAPPYFTLLLITAEGTVANLYLHPIQVGSNHLIPVESTTERAFAQKLVEQGCAVIKPVRMEDTGRFLHQLGLGLVNSGDWPYRPDFIVPWHRNGFASLEVREVRGFLKGSMPYYDNLIELKAEAYRQMSTSVPVHYREVDGCKLPQPQPCQSPDDWPGIKWRAYTRDR